MVESLSILPNYRFIITGGPGSGKTALVEAIKNLGYKGFPEIARDLINQGFIPPTRADKPDKPDSGRFLELVIQKRILLHRQIKGMEIGFYDRGIPDSIAYIKFQNKKVPRILSEAIETYRYNQVVFVTPPWEEIFFNDSVRWETFHQAGMLYELATEAYQEAGYSLVELPQSSLELRLELISKYAPLTLR